MSICLSVIHSRGAVTCGATFCIDYGMDTVWKRFKEVPQRLAICALHCIQSPCRPHTTFIGLLWCLPSLSKMKDRQLRIEGFQLMLGKTVSSIASAKSCVFHDVGRKATSETALCEMARAMHKDTDSCFLVRRRVLRRCADIRFVVVHLHNDMTFDSS